MFLLEPPQEERLAVAVGLNITAIQPLQKPRKKASYSEDLSKIFPDAKNIFDSNKSIELE